MEEVLIHFAPNETVEERDEKLYEVYIKHMPIEMKQFTFHLNGQQWVDDLKSAPIDDTIYQKADKVIFSFVYMP